MDRCKFGWCVLLFAVALYGCEQSRSPGSLAENIGECRSTLELKMVLADTPGPNGHPLAYTPWVLSIGPEPHGMDLIEPADKLASGETGEDGLIVVSEPQKVAVRDALCDASKTVWLSYPGQAVRVEVLQSQSDWTEDERLFHLLKSQDYCSGVEAYSEDALATPDGKACVDQAMRAYGVSTNEALIERISSSQESDQQ